MRRWILGVALSGFDRPSSGRWAADCPPQGQPAATDARRPARPPHHRHLQRFKYSSYGVWVRTMGPGYPAYRYTYSGQKDNFPLPAIFQSGSEHTNYTWRPGF